MGKNAQNARKGKKAAAEAEATTTVAPEAPEGKVIQMSERKSKKGTAPKLTKGDGTGMTKLPSLAKARVRKPRPTRPCACGCGGETKSRFCPGHDSYLRGLVIRVQREVMSLDEVEERGGKGQRAAVEAELKQLAKATKVAEAK